MYAPLRSESGNIFVYTCIQECICPPDKCLKFTITAKHSKSIFCMYMHVCVCSCVYLSLICMHTSNI